MILTEIVQKKLVLLLRILSSKRGQLFLPVCHQFNVLFFGLDLVVLFCLFLNLQEIQIYLNYDYWKLLTSTSFD